LTVEEDIVECGATTDPLLKSRRNPQTCGFKSSVLICRTLRFAYWGVQRWKKNPKRQRGTNALGVAGGEGS
jgi:hypothetical protein